MGSGPPFPPAHLATALRTTHALISGDFNSKLTLVTTTEGGNRPEMTMTWIGECKPGMKAGDVIMSNGM